MKFSVNTKELIQALNLVYPALGSPQDKPILRTFRLNIKDTNLVIEAMNTHVYAKTLVVIEPVDTEEGTFCLDLLMLDLLKEFDNEVTTFTLQDDTILVEQKDRVHKLTLINADNYPTPFEVASEYHSLPHNLFDALQKCLIGVSTDMNRPALQCYKINPELNCIVTSDGQQLTQYKNLDMIGEVTLPSAMILGSVFKLFEVITTQDDTQLSLNKNQLGLKSKKINSEIRFQSMGVKSINLEEIFDRIKGYGILASFLVPKADIVKSLKIARIYESRGLSQGSPCPVRLTIKDNNLILEMTVKSLSEMREIIPVKILEMNTEVEEVELKFSANLLLEFFTVSTSDNVILTLHKGNPDKTPFQFQDEDNQDYTYLQMPMIVS